MIRIIATFPIKPDCIDKALEIGKELVTETRKEEGCLQYDLIQSTNDPCEIVVVENWQSASALDAHSKSPHYKSAVPALTQLCTNPPTVSQYRTII